MDDCKPLGDGDDQRGFSRAQGRAVQVGPINCCVESAYDVCNQRLKLQYDETLSESAFNFNLRRYNKEIIMLLKHEGGRVGFESSTGRTALAAAAAAGRIDMVTVLVELGARVDHVNRLGRAVQVDPIKPTLKAPESERLITI